MQSDVASSVAPLPSMLALQLSLLAAAAAWQMQLSAQVRQ